MDRSRLLVAGIFELSVAFNEKLPWSGHKLLHAVCERDHSCKQTRVLRSEGFGMDVKKMMDL